MAELSVLQRRDTRTRLSTDQSVATTTNAVTTAFERCDDVVAWTDGPYDLSAESEPGPRGERRRASVDVHEREGRTHVLVDATTSTHDGGSQGNGTEPSTARRDSEPDSFHDAVLAAIVATLTDTPERQIAPADWEPRTDLDVAETESARGASGSADAPTDATDTDRPGAARSQRATRETVHEQPDSGRDPVETQPADYGLLFRVVFGSGLAALTAFLLATFTSNLLGFLGGIGALFYVLVSIVRYQEASE